MCSLAQSAILQKEECLITVSTNHTVGVNGLDVREGKGKKDRKQSDMCKLLKSKYKMGVGKASANLMLLGWNGTGLTS